MLRMKSMEVQTMDSLVGDGCRGQVKYACDVRHVMEFFWNTSLLAQDMEPLPASTHGRVVEELFTVTGTEPLEDF